MKTMPACVCVFLLYFLCISSGVCSKAEFVDFIVAAELKKKSNLFCCDLGEKLLLSFKTHRFV